MKKRLVGFLLILVIALSEISATGSKPVKANAEETIYIEGIGNLKILYTGQNDYTISLDENKNLVVKSIYHTDSTATLSYHTSVLYFATRDSGMNPGSLPEDERFSVGVEVHDTVISGNKSYDTYTVPCTDLEDMIVALFGTEGLKTARKVYISEGFRLKERKTVASPWKTYGEVYDSLEGIRGAAEWSDTTYSNFSNYYDIEITLELAKYRVTVESGDGGIVGQSHETAYSGDRITVNAYPNEDYNFAGWKVVSGAIREIDLNSAKSYFRMPSSDVVLRADFTKKETPPVTRPPVITKEPPEAAPTPTPEPTPEPTPRPTYIPEESSETIQKSVRYYSTDAGYSIGGIYNRDIYPMDDAFGYVGTTGQNNKGYRFEETVYENKGSYTYAVGTDSDGNLWYFIPDGNNAVYVHPKVYGGYSADSADVRYISELIFPSVIFYDGSSYSVTSIGGGTDKYALYGEYDVNRPISYGVCGPTFNSYELYSQQVNSGSGLTAQTNAETRKRILGVIGNGQIVSSFLFVKSYENGTYSQVQFENSYYVYNTTLRYITIPDTVTAIESYAFSGCQALVKISGGKNVKTVGEYAFSAVGEQVLKKSSAKQNSSGSVRTFEYYYYNGSYSFETPTSTMEAFGKSVMLSDYMEFPVFDSLKKLGVFSFENRKNLYVVTLPAGTEEIGANTFSGCFLDKITVPGKKNAIGDVLIPSREVSRINTTPEQTFGTKGKNVTEKTLIMTELNSKAMDYGLTYEDYYDVRAGYDIIYHNNSTPTETYETKPAITKKKELLKERYPLSGSFITVDGEKYYEKEVLLDVNGGLYLASYNNLPVRQIPELSFNNIYTFILKSGSETTDAHWGTVVSEPCTTVNCCLAFADNGTVFLFRSDVGIWNALDITPGSFNFAFHKNVFGQGGQSGSQTDETLDLFYINADGVLLQKRIYSMRTTAAYSYYRNDFVYSYGLNGSAATVVTLPEGVSAIKRFCFSQESTGNPGYPPEINIQDTAGNVWVSDSGGWSGQEFYRAYPIGNMETREEQELCKSRGITDFGPRLIGYSQIEKIYDLMFESFGKEFLGWTLRADGTGLVYQPGYELNITAPTTLFAKWDGNSKKRIQYIANGGTGTMEEDVYPADAPNPVVLRKNAFTRSGYEFCGWSYKKTPGKDDYIFSDESRIVIAPGDTRIYAQWEPVEYIIRVGTDDIRVDNQVFSEYTMRQDDELILEMLADRILTVLYDLNDRDGTGAFASAEFVSELTKRNTEASLRFWGWRLYEDTDKDAKITSKDIYIGYYEANSVLVNLGQKQGAVFYAFPCWGGNASYVRLPEVLREGYVFVGYTLGKAYEADWFDTGDTYTKAISENTLIPVPAGSDAQYQPKIDGEVLYAYYEKVKSEGQVYGFEVYDVFGTMVWEEVVGDGYRYGVGIPEEDTDVWKTLPLRNGVHPYYRNLGGLPYGGGFSFRIMSTGNFAEEDTMLTIVPHLCLKTEEGYREADFFFEQKTDSGVFLKKWSDTEETMALYADKDSVYGEDLSNRIWYGNFRLPDILLPAEKDTDVTAYQQQYGLSFEEDFWIKDGKPVLRFSIRAETGGGEYLYYGMIPEEGETNIWLQEAGVSYRDDSEGERFELRGGEVAIIYPGDTAEKWNDIHGIY